MIPVRCMKLGFSILLPTKPIICSAGARFGISSRLWPKRFAGIKLLVLAATRLPSLPTKSGCIQSAPPRSEWHGRRGSASLKPLDEQDRRRDQSRNFAAEPPLFHRSASPEPARVYRRRGRTVFSSGRNHDSVCWPCLHRKRGGSCCLEHARLLAD